MKYKNTYYIFWILLFPFIVLGQNFPGGVYGAEVWYISDSLDIENGHFENHASGDIDLTACDFLPPNGSSDLGYLNFNPAIDSETACFQYRAPLERSSDKNFFLVGEPMDLDESYPLISSKLGVFGEYIPPVEALSENTYIIETKQGYASRMATTFEQYQNAHVYFYGWNNYDIDRRFKSYGRKGETTFTIGQSYTIPEVFENGGRPFTGLLPEYISFDRQLTKNERNRVESYLALKYGITKWNTDSYKDSQNKVYWDQINNGLFRNNIFGIGRDSISNLYQLICESAHKKGYLVAGTKQILETNLEMQRAFSIENENFLAFGDSGDSGLLPLNANHLERLKKVWLAQVTGDDIRNIPINFRLNLQEDFNSQLEEILENRLTLWMLRDSRVNNRIQSNFENDNVEYYKADGIGGNLELGYYVDFRNEGIVFDQDRSVFDQFTFAVGPDCLVKFQPEYDCSEAENGSLTCYKLHIIVIGGCKEPKFLDANGTTVFIEYNEEQTIIQGHDTYTARVCAPDLYTAILEVGSSEVLEFEYQAEGIGPYIVDLGPETQYLTSQQLTILLDAGQYMNDPGTTFQWFFNGVEIYNQNSTFLVEEAGQYCVIVTTPDGVCKIKKCVNVLVSELEAKINCYSGNCSEEGNQIEINILTGVPPYTIIVENENGQLPPYVPTENPYWISGLPEGPHTIVITDSRGSVLEHLCEFEGGESNTIISLGENCLLSSTNPSCDLDASVLAENNPQAIYQWSRNGEPMPQDTAIITVVSPGNYSVKVYPSIDSECFKKGIQIVNTSLEVVIEQTPPCEDEVNTVYIEITFGFPEYTTEIIGVNGTIYPPYSFTHSASANRSLPAGIYMVTTTDTYGNSIQQEVDFISPMNQSLEEQLLVFCQDDCTVFQNYCNTPYTFFDFSQSSIPDEITLEASLLVESNDSFSFSWTINGVFVSAEQTLTLHRDQSCAQQYPPSQGCEVLTIQLYVDGIDDYKLCSFIETVMIDSNWCHGILPSRGYTSKVFPNPTDSEVTFFYNISSISGDIFEGRVEVFSILGSLIYSEPIEGLAEYTMSYSLVASGVYLIKTTTTDGTVTVDRVIIK